MTFKIKYFRKNEDGLQEIVTKEYSSDKYVKLFNCSICNHSFTNLTYHNKCAYHQTALKVLEENPNLKEADEIKKAIYQYRVKNNSDNSSSSSDDEEKKVKRKLQMDNVARRHYDIKYGISNLVNKLANNENPQTKSNLEKLKKYRIKYPKHTDLLSVSHLLSAEDLELIKLQTTNIAPTAPDNIPNIASYVMEQCSGITCF